MAFDDIINNTPTSMKDYYTEQVLKRQEYNRRYQAKLRERSKLMTLERKIDANVAYVIGYIKDKYAYELEHYITPAEAKITTKAKTAESPAFTNWLILSANEYKSAKEAYEVSTLNKMMKFKEFKELFNKYYGEVDDNKYAKLTP